MDYIDLKWGGGAIKKTTVLPLVSTVEKTIIMSGP